MRLETSCGSTPLFERLDLLADPMIAVGHLVTQPLLRSVGGLGGGLAWARSWRASLSCRMGPNSMATELAQADAIVSDLDEAAALILTLDTS